MIYYYLIQVFQGRSASSSSCYRVGAVRSASSSTTFCRGVGSVLNIYKSCTLSRNAKYRIYCRWSLWSRLFRLSCVWGVKFCDLCRRTYRCLGLTTYTPGINCRFEQLWKTLLVRSCLKKKRSPDVGCEFDRFKGRYSSLQAAYHTSISRFISTPL